VRQRPWRGARLQDLESLMVDEAIRALDPGLTADDLVIPQPRTDDELLDLTERYLGVRIPRAAVCAGHVAPATAFCDAYFARQPWQVWWAARGVGGKSMMLATLVWMETLTLRCSASVLGGSGEQSARVHDYLRGFWLRPNVPHAALASDPSQRRTTLRWGNHVEAQLASPRSVRGAHPPRLRIDEADECEWAIVEAARGQPMTRDGVESNVVFSSTLQHADGTMVRLMNEAAVAGMPVHKWCYRESMEPHGWLSEAALNRFRATVSAELWRVEVELGEPSPEGRAILPEAVDAMFEGASIRTEDRVEYEFEAPVEGGQYGTGADWARSQDFTEVVTIRFDVTPHRVVAYRRGHRRPWPEMIGWLDARLARYPGDAAHDATGVGDVVAEYIEHDAEDVQLVGRARTDLFTEFIAGVERGELRSPRWEALYQAIKYCKADDLWGAGHPPDGFVAASLAYRAGLGSRRPMRVLTTLPREQDVPDLPAQQAPQEGERQMSDFERQVSQGLWWPGQSRATEPDNAAIIDAARSRGIVLRK
jgi:hypothetical protein